MQTRALILMFNSLLFPIAITAQHPSASKPVASEKLFSVNLLKNGTLEAATDDAKKVPDWKPADGFTVVSYGSVGSEWDWGLSGCPSCGKQYVRLQFGDTVHELSTSQIVDISAASSDIDKGNVTADASAWLGGFQDADTTSVIEVSFQDASGKELGKFATDPVDMTKLPKPERGSTSLVLCQKSATVPAGTRKIVFTWHAKATGDSGDFLALGDNFTLSLAKPKP